MARPLKSGVQYYPKDTDFYYDTKIRTLRAKFGTEGMYLLDFLHGEIYRDNGYFLEMNENTAYLISDGAGCGITPEKVTDIIQGCCDIGLFDKNIFEKFGVLTSSSIQRTYLRILNSRETIEIIEDFFTLNIENKCDVPASISSKILFKKNKNTDNPFKKTDNPLKNTDNPVKSKENTQRKEKKRKENKSKENNNAISVPEELKEAFNDFDEMRKSLKKPLTDRSKQLLINKLEELAPNDFEKQNKIIEQSTVKCWLSFFPLSGEKNEKPKQCEDTTAAYSLEEYRARQGKPLKYEKRGG